MCLLGSNYTLVEDHVPLTCGACFFPNIPFVLPPLWWQQLDLFKLIAQTIIQIFLAFKKKKKKSLMSQPTITGFVVLYLSFWNLYLSYLCLEWFIIIIIIEVVMPDTEMAAWFKGMTLHFWKFRIRLSYPWTLIFYIKPFLWIVEKPFISNN